MPYSLGERSRQRLQGVHPDLVKVVERAIQITPVDFTVLEGLRTIQRQQELLASGATTTLKSRHLTGHAIDLGAFVGGEVRWDWPLYHKIAVGLPVVNAILRVITASGMNFINNLLRP